MILSKTPLTLAAVKHYTKDSEVTPQMRDYLKTFCKISKEEAEKLISEIKALNNPKLNEEFIVKVVDFLPQDIEDLNKISPEIGLNEEESKAILSIINKN